MTYTEYVLTHWEEPDAKGRLVAKDGYVSVTPEWIYKQLQSFSPIGYQEGQVTVDLPVSSLIRCWTDLGGDVEVEK